MDVGTVHVQLWELHGLMEIIVDNNYNVALLISQQHKARLLDGSPYTSSPSPTIMSFIYVFLGPSDIDGPRNRHFEEEIK